MASVGRNCRKESGVFNKKNTSKEKGKSVARKTSTMESENEVSTDDLQENEVGMTTRGKHKANNKMAELKNKMKKKIMEKKMEISDPRSRIYSGNSSFVRKKLSSLKTNNRELASALAASRQGVRKLQNQNLCLQQENHALAQRVITLQGRARELQGVLRKKKDNEQEYKRKMSDVQSVLQKVSTSLLGTVEHIGSAMEVCHPALRDSGWRTSSLSTQMSVSDDSDGSFPPQPRLSVLGPGPLRVPLTAGKRPSLAPPGNNRTRLSVSVPPTPSVSETEAATKEQVIPRDSVSAVESAPILFAEEVTEADKQSAASAVESHNSAVLTANQTDSQKKAEDASAENRTKEAQKKGDKRRGTFTQPQNASKPSAVPATDDRRHSTMTMPPPVKVPSKNPSGQIRRGTYTVPTPASLPNNARRGTYTVSTNAEEVPEKRESLMELVAEHKRKSQDALGQESSHPPEPNSKSLSEETPETGLSEETAVTEVTQYIEEDMDLTAVPVTLISTEEAEEDPMPASREIHRPVDKGTKKNTVLTKGKTSQKDLNQSGCKPVRKVKGRKPSKLPALVKTGKTSANVEKRKEAEGDNRSEERGTNDNFSQMSEECSQNAADKQTSQESEIYVEEYDVGDVTDPKPVWALEQREQIIQENVGSTLTSCQTDDSDDEFVDKRRKKKTQRIVSTDSDCEVVRNGVQAESSENESGQEFARKKKNGKCVTEKNIKVSTKMTKKGLVVQSTSTKTSAKAVEDATGSNVQQKKGRESVSVFDLSSGDMFSEPSPLTLKPVVSREHTQEDDNAQVHSRKAKPKHHGRVKGKQDDNSVNKNRQNVLVTESESSDEEEQENITRRKKTLKSSRQDASVPESPSLHDDAMRKLSAAGRKPAERQSDEGQIVRPRRRATVAVKYFESDSEDDQSQGRKSSQQRLTRRSSNYSLSEEEENTGMWLPTRRTPQVGPQAGRQRKVYQDASDSDATTPLVERSFPKRRAFQDVGNTPQKHGDTAGTKTKGTPQTGPTNQKKRPFSSIGSCEDAQEGEENCLLQNQHVEDEPAEGVKRARRSRQQVSYKEPTLNSKLRRGDPMTIKFGDWSPQTNKGKYKPVKKRLSKGHS